MPRVRQLDKTAYQERLESDIIKKFGGMLVGVPQLMTILGKHSRQAAIKWATSQDLKTMNVNGRKHWWVSDIARALDRSEI